MRIIFPLSIVWITLTLSACTDGSSGSPSAWVRIDSPVDGFSTGSDSVTVEGNAAMGDATIVPGPIYWYNNGASGVLPSQTICILACVAAFQGNVPLFIGTNMITVRLDEGADTVTVIRYPQVVARGSVAMTSTGFAVPGVTMTLSGDRNSAVVTDENGLYSFSNVRDGSYSVQASLIPPQSTGCLSLVPDRHDFVVVTDVDIDGLDFMATQLMPCYVISGHITASTNPDAGISDVRMTLTDSFNNEYVVYSNSAGNYVFYHLESGTYTITPGDSYGGTYIPGASTITITNSDVTAIDFVKVFN